MKKKKNGFAATGILYTILLLFLALMTTLLVTLSSRSKVLEKLKKDAKDEVKTIVGIVGKEYIQGEVVSYLGYNWLVMKDNGTNTQLVMDGYLTDGELKENLPTDLPSSFVSNGMPVCYNTASGTYSGYCNSGSAYTWNTSLVKPTIENWLTSKMTEKGLTTENELVGMSFSDGVETINSYIRIPLYDEVSSMNGSCSSDSGYSLGSPYCGDTSNYMFTNYEYWTLTRKYSTSVYWFHYLNSSTEGPGGVFIHFVATNERIRPVITVKEK